MSISPFTFSQHIVINEAFKAKHDLNPSRIGAFADKYLSLRKTELHIELGEGLATKLVTKEVKGHVGKTVLKVVSFVTILLPLIALIAQGVYRSYCRDLLKKFPTSNLENPKPEPDIKPETAPNNSQPESLPVGKPDTKSETDPKPTSAEQPKDARPTSRALPKPPTSSAPKPPVSEDPSSIPPPPPLPPPSALQSPSPIETKSASEPNKSSPQNKSSSHTLGHTQQFSLTDALKNRKDLRVVKEEEKNHEKKSDGGIYDSVGKQIDSSRKSARRQITTQFFRGPTLESEWDDDDDSSSSQQQASSSYVHPIASSSSQVTISREQQSTKSDVESSSEEEHAAQPALKEEGTGILADLLRDTLVARRNGGIGGTVMGTIKQQGIVNKLNAMGEQGSHVLNASIQIDTLSYERQDALLVDLESRKTLTAAELDQIIRPVTPVLGTVSTDYLKKSIIKLMKSNQEVTFEDMPNVSESESQIIKEILEAVKGLPGKTKLVKFLQTKETLSEEDVAEIKQRIQQSQTDRAASPAGNAPRRKKRRKNH